MELLREKAILMSLCGPLKSQHIALGLNCGFRSDLSFVFRLWTEENSVFEKKTVLFRMR